MTSDTLTEQMKVFIKTEIRLRTSKSFAVEIFYFIHVVAVCIIVFFLIEGAVQQINGLRKGENHSRHIIEFR